LILNQEVRDLSDRRDDVSESGRPPAQPDDLQPAEIRSPFRRPLAAIGAAIVAAGAFAFVVLVAIDFTTGRENPYRSLVTFIVLPLFISLGVIVFLVSLQGQRRRARQRGEKVRFLLRVTPSDPRFMRTLWLFLGVTVLLVGVLAYSGFKAFEATDTVAFCGETCHEVMGPQNVTYANSPHARVPCAECHIGPGGSFWVRAKIDGIRQVWHTVFNTYDRPIETPVENLRPAQETCEECHWPQQFFGDKLVTRHYYRTDELNSPWTVTLRLKVGGGNPATGALEGIHWHMLSEQITEYIATDLKRSEIPWVRVSNPDGEVVALYTDPDVDLPQGDEALEEAGYEIRTFDCMDCHNRPSHVFQPPAVAMNLEISKGNIAKDLPFIRRVGLELLNADYRTTEEANAAITAGLWDFYNREYPDVAGTRSADIEAAADELLNIYNLNFFPEMETDYRDRENHLSHFVNQGCFRCHFSDLETADGLEISATCETCHDVVAQGPSDDVEDLTQNINGLEFVHPVSIGEVWKTIQCTQCHTPASGY
jgi:hypothetical protein